MTVDLASTDTSTTVDPAVIAPTETGADNSAALSEDAAMEAVWDKLVVSNGAERENGKFVSPDHEKRAAAEAAKETPLEGGEEGNANASTVSEVPLPANWAGKDALWAKLPADVKTEIAEHQTAQHAKFSDMGRKVAAFEPLNNVGNEVSQYLSAAAQRAGAKYDGPKTPAEGVAYLFNIQRMMDADAPGTLMQIMDTYGVRDKIAAALGVKAGEGAQPDQTARLLSEIADLKRTIASNRFDPAMIEQVVDKKNAASRHDEEVSRLTDPKVKPLYAEIPETRMVFFINEAWDKLGPDATKAAVLDHAYAAAIEADPALRAKSQAAKTAANDDAAKTEAAKRGNSVNVKSTASTKVRPVSEEDAMDAVWRKHHP